jgi:hypothetical protein
VGFLDQDRDRKRRFVSAACCFSELPVYEFELPASSGEALLALYTSLKFAVRRWRKGLSDRRKDRVLGALDLAVTSGLPTIRELGIRLPSDFIFATSEITLGEAADGDN